MSESVSISVRVSVSVSESVSRSVSVRRKQVVFVLLFLERAVSGGGLGRRIGRRHVHGSSRRHCVCVRSSRLHLNGKPVSGKPVSLDMSVHIIMGQGVRRRVVVAALQFFSRACAFGSR